MINLLKNDATDKLKDLFEDKRTLSDLSWYTNKLLEEVEKEKSHKEKLYKEKSNKSKD